MRREDYDTQAAVLLREYAKHYDPERPGSAALRSASDAISQHVAQFFDPAWLPKGKS